MPEYYKRNPNTKCLICNKPIYRRPVELKRSKGSAFCTSICYGIACRREVPCIICQKPILSRFRKKTCSRTCSNKNRAGIKYKIGRPKDKVRSQQALKIRLVKLRGKECERCGYNKPEILQVHHKDRDRKNNEFENLELVCPNCHAEEHYFKNSWLKTAHI